MSLGGATVGPAVALGVVTCLGVAAAVGEARSVAGALGLALTLALALEMGARVGIANVALSVGWVVCAGPSETHPISRDATTTEIAGALVTARPPPALRWLKILPRACPAPTRFPGVRDWALR